MAATSASASTDRRRNRGHRRQRGRHIAAVKQIRDLRGCAAGSTSAVTIGTRWLPEQRDVLAEPACRTSELLPCGDRLRVFAFQRLAIVRLDREDVVAARDPGFDQSQFQRVERNRSVAELIRQVREHRRPVRIERPQVADLVAVGVDPRLAARAGGLVATAGDGRQVCECPATAASSSPTATDFELAPRRSERCRPAGEVRLSSRMTMSVARL